MSGVLEAAVAGPGRGVKQHWQSAEDPHGREGRGQMRQATDGQMEGEDREPRGRDGAGWGVLPAREGVSGEVHLGCKFICTLSVTVCRKGQNTA